MKFTLQLLSVLLCISVAAIAGDGKVRKGVYEAPFTDPPVEYAAPTNAPAAPHWGTSNPAGGGGIYTTLSGFYDFQSNGGACQHIQVDPATGALHVAYMSSPDSLAPGGAHPARNVYYAYSTDGGTTWDTFGGVQVPGPPYRAGFACITMGTGALASSPVIANHNAVGVDPVVSRIYVDSPPGVGFFSELGSPPALGGTLEPIWPNISSTADGSIMMSASPNAAAAPFALYRAGLAPDLFTWDGWTEYPGLSLLAAAAGRAPIHANGTGRVSIMYNNTNGNTGVYYLESTDNGLTWPTTPVLLYDAVRPAGADTFTAYVQSDLVYNGDEPLFAIAEFDGRVGTPSSPGIVFYSESAGFVKAVKFDSTLYVPENNPRVAVQRFHQFSVGWPVIGMSGTTIGIAYQAFQTDTSVISGYNYSDVWYVKSEDNGATWSTPENLTNTPLLDERYPSISKWNAPGEFNITYQEDTEPGSHAFADLAPTTRAYLVYNKVSFTTGVENEGAVPSAFRLEQNYPNPFNPSTKISFTVPQKSPVRLTVTNLLGEEVATLVNEVREAGTYEFTFSASSIPSGVYFYTLNAGEFVSTRKMLVLK